jgi:chromosome segregation ATPase
MAQDRELDQLKDEQDRAFQRRQDTWQRQNDAWQIRSPLQDALNRARDRQQEAYDVQQQAWERRQSAQTDTSRAYEAKQGAYDDQQGAWDELNRLRDSNGPRIGALREEHDDMFERIKSLSGEIDQAFSWGNKDEAFEKIEEVKQLRSDIRDLPPQWRELSAEISEAKEVHVRASERFKPLQADFVRFRRISDAAKAEHERARDDFKAAQARCRQAQAEFEAAKAEHERHQDEFRAAKQESDRAKDAFTHRLNELRAEQSQRADDKYALAQQAGVPSQYWGDVWVSTDDDGTVNIYFGGIGEPAGEGHGHYAMDASGYVTYRRDPFDPHGAHNFTDFEERVAAPPRAQRSNWYTKSDGRDETIHEMVDKAGNLTTDYPHVHVIHDEKNHEIRVVASHGQHSHSETMTLSGDASGNDVNAAVAEMRRRL